MKLKTSDFVALLVLIAIIAAMLGVMVMAQEENTNHPAPHTIVLEGRN